MSIQHSKRHKWKEDKREYRSRTSTYSLTYNMTEAQKLKQLAQSFNQSVPSYLKSVIKSHLNSNGFILHPNQEQHIVALEMLLRKSANNINQLVRHVHTNQHLPMENIASLQTILINTKKAVISHLTHPQTIEEVLHFHLQNQPDKRSQILQFIKDLNLLKDDN